MEKKISIIIPVYNETGNIQLLYQRLVKCLEMENITEFLFIDDGSTDDSLHQIKLLSEKDDRVRYLSFSKNFGHQNALKAGIDHVTGDCAISLDADLQHPPELILEMIDLWKNGMEIINTERDDRKNVPFLKRVTASLFYAALNRLSEIKIENGAADFRLLDRKIIDVLRKNEETFLFLRGMISWVGFKKTTLKYVPEKRHSGKTKYSLKKMILFALTGITSFSISPLRFTILLGFIFSFFSGIYGLYAIYAHFYGKFTVNGWSSVIASVLFIGGVQLIVLGIIGEYIGKMFLEVKKRPQYIIREEKLG